MSTRNEPSGRWANHQDIFCHICSECTQKEHRRDMSDVVKRAYLGYFGIKPGDQDKAWAQHIVFSMYRTITPIE